MTVQEVMLAMAQMKAQQQFDHAWFLNQRMHWTTMQLVSTAKQLSCQYHEAAS